MQYSILAILATVASVSASVCQGGLYTNPQCCATDVLGAADLNCKVPSQQPRDATDLKHICSVKGQAAMCCAVPVAGQALLCKKAI